MQNIKPVYLTTLQEASIDDSCGMRLWYTKFHAGGGLTPNSAILSNEMYEATLSDMRIIALMEDISQPAIQEMIDEILLSLTPDDHKNHRAKELLYRRLGWMAAYALFMEPEIRKIYSTIDIDEMATVERESLMVNVPTSGRLLQNRVSKHIEHREFLMTGTANSKWREGWEWHIRPHLMLLAIREGLGQPVNSARIVGLNTGFVANVENAQLHHPYVYGHFNTSNGEWTHQFKLADEDGGSWRERPVWEYPGSLTDWVLKVGAPIGEGQFPTSPRIMLNRRMIEDWLSQRLHRERTIQSMKLTAHQNLNVRTLHFQRRTDQCSPVWSPACPFKDLCWSEPFMAEALQQTKFTANLTAPLVPSEPVRPIPTIPYMTMSEQVEAAIAAGRASTVEGAIPNLTRLPY